MQTRRRFVTGLTAGCLSAGLTQAAPEVFERCGVRFEVLRRGNSPKRYLFIHGDEYMVFEVLTKFMAAHDGIAYLTTGKERNVEIMGAKIDPNRMWSRTGAEMSLRAQNAVITQETIAAVLRFLDGEREGLVRRLTPGRGSRLVALHNNRDYSVQDEVAASDSVSTRQPDLPRYFFLCTKATDFEVLKRSPYNVVLQTKPEPDDGSLSRLAARRGFRYINLECAIYDEEAQRERLEWLERNVT
jgi:hypothetical protein